MRKSRRWIVCFILTGMMILMFQYVFVWRRAISYREYEPSGKFYEVPVDDVRIHNMYFTFEQVKEVAGLSDCFEKLYHPDQEVVLTKHPGFKERFCNFSNMKTFMKTFPDDAGKETGAASTNARCWLDETGNMLAVAFSYIYPYHTVSGDPDESDIQVYISDQKLKNSGLPDIQKENSSPCTIYDYNRFDLIEHNRIFQSQKVVNGMESYHGNVCTAYSDGTKYYYFCTAIGGDIAEVENQIQYYCKAVCSLII